MFLMQVRILLTFESDLTLTTSGGFGTFKSAESLESQLCCFPDIGETQKTRYTSLQNSILLQQHPSS